MLKSDTSNCHYNQSTEGELSSCDQSYYNHRKLNRKQLTELFLYCEYSTCWPGLTVTRTLVSINVVTLRRTQLILGWVTVCGWVNQPPRTTQPFIPPWYVNRVPAFLARVRQGTFTCVGCQVTLCDPIWQVTSRSSVVCRQTAISFNPQQAKTTEKDRITYLPRMMSTRACRNSRYLQTVSHRYKLLSVIQQLIRTGETSTLRWDTDTSHTAADQDRWNRYTQVWHRYKPHSSWSGQVKQVHSGGTQIQAIQQLIRTGETGTPRCDS